MLSSGAAGITSRGWLLVEFFDVVSMTEGAKRGKKQSRRTPRPLSEVAGATAQSCRIPHIDGRRPIPGLSQKSNIPGKRHPTLHWPPRRSEKLWISCPSYNRGSRTDRNRGICPGPNEQALQGSPKERPLCHPFIWEGMSRKEDRSPHKNIACMPKSRTLVVGAAAGRYVLAQCSKACSKPAASKRR